MKNWGIVFVFAGLVSCTSTRQTVLNINDQAVTPPLKEGRFILTQKSNDPKYGYNEAYPVNVFYLTANNDTINAVRYLKSLRGPQGEPLTFTHVGSCCPFPSTRTLVGAGFLQIYELESPGFSGKKRLYINPHAKGEILIPEGLSSADLSQLKR